MCCRSLSVCVGGSGGGGRNRVCLVTWGVATQPKSVGGGTQVGGQLTRQQDKNSRPPNDNASQCTHLDSAHCRGACCMKAVIEAAGPQTIMHGDARTSTPPTQSITHAFKRAHRSQTRPSGRNQTRSRRRPRATWGPVCARECVLHWLQKISVVFFQGLLTASMREGDQQALRKP